MTFFVEIRPEDYNKTAFTQFSARRGAFDIADALAMMWMSQLAYESGAPRTIDVIGPHWGFNSVQAVPQRGQILDTHAIVGVRDDCTVVAFAGTDPGILGNLIADAEFKLSAANTHQGFQDSVDGMWSDLEPLLRSGPAPLFFTGHSLGAAMAAIAAERAVRLPVTIAAVYGFGMPRPGGPAFARSYGTLGERTYRLVHGGDIVACVPDLVDAILPGRIRQAIQFQHVGHMLGCASGGKFNRNAPLAPITDNDPHFTEGVLADLRDHIHAFLAGRLLAPPAPGELGRLWALLPFAIRDHLQDRYWTALTP